LKVIPHVNVKHEEVVQANEMAHAQNHREKEGVIDTEEESETESSS